MHCGGIDADRDLPAIGRLLSHAFAGTPEGSALDRGDYCRNRVEQMREVRFAGFGAPSATGDGLDGYLSLAQRRKPDTGRFDVALSDLAGDDRALDALGAAFAGPTPWMLDFF